MIVRRDLPPGLLAAQIVHASGESSRMAAALPANTHAIVLSAADQDELLVLEARLRFACVRFTAIRENDAPWSGQLMALGLMPVRREEVRRLVSSLPLLR